MKCLNCGKRLSNKILKLFGGEYYICSCGLDYSPEFIEMFTKKEWNKIRRWKMFTVHKYSDGSKILVFHSIKNKVVHPLHYKLHHFLVKRGWIKEWDF